MVEFVLIVSMMLVLVVAVSDLGRIFAAGIVLEAATRNAAEVAANEYLASPPSPINAPIQPPGNPNYYPQLRLNAAKTACAEVRELPNTQYDAGTGTCPGMPLTLVCVHDGQDPGCADEAFGAAIPPDCSELATPPTNISTSGTSRYVEVRLCYQFDSIIDLPLVSFGTFWLQRSRTFVIPCYFAMDDEECG